MPTPVETDDTTPAPAQVTEQPPAAPPAPSPTDMPPAQPPAAPAAGEGGDEGTGGPPAGDTEAAKLRREAANWRTKLREQEAATAAAKQLAETNASQMAELKATLEGIAKVFNPQSAEQEPPDPAKLAEQIAQMQAAQAEKDTAHAAQVRDLTVRAALPTVLGKAQADPALTEAVLTASGALAKLDPTADTFTADLESAVAAAVEANPRLKIAPVAVRSGAEIPGRSGGSDQLTLEQVRAMKPEQIEEARKAGRLRNLLGG